MSTTARSAKARRSKTTETAQSSAGLSSPLNAGSIGSDYLAHLSESDWMRLSSAVSLVRALIEYEIRECQEVFADNPNEESLSYWRECLSEAEEAQTVLTQIRATARHLT